MAAKETLENVTLRTQVQEREEAKVVPQLANLREGVGSAQPFASKPTKTQHISGTVTLDKVYGVVEPGGIHRIMGTSNPAAGVNTNLFTVLGSHTARISMLWVANRRKILAKIKVGFDLAGDGTNTVPDDAWLYYNVEVPGESTLVLDAATGLWLAETDDVVICTDVGGVSFGASGAEYATV